MSIARGASKVLAATLTGLRQWLVHSARGRFRSFGAWDGNWGAVTKNISCLRHEEIASKTKDYVSGHFPAEQTAATKVLAYFCRPLRGLESRINRFLSPVGLG